MEPFENFTTEFMLISEWQKLNPNIVAGFTTKNGGYSNQPFESFNLGLHVKDEKEVVHQNREKLGTLTGFKTSRFVCSDQVHDSKVAKVTKQDAGKGVFDYEDAIPLTDGIYTNEPNLLLTSCYADCVPLYFYAPHKNLIGVAHAGWKGTVKRIGENMVKCWEEDEHVSANHIHVVIGPAIHDCCYIVDDVVIDAVKNVLGDSDCVPYKEVSTGQYRLDLSLLNKVILINAGISEKNIMLSSLCTSCEEAMFFSHRRDSGKTGRMMSFIGYRED
jgi:YfiH family protein